jgi:hypothetical protein
VRGPLPNIEVQAMQKLIDILLGIKPSPWAQGGQRHLEWLEMPKHDKLFLLLLISAAVVWAVMYLYRKEGRGLSLAIRASLSALRLVALAGVVIMLLEPVIVFTKTEYVPSTILVLRDASESMDLKDAYATQAHADRTAQDLHLAGGAKQLRDTPRAQLIDLALKNGLSKELTANGDRLLATHAFTGQFLSESTTQPSATTQPAAADRTTTALGTAIRQAMAAYRGQPLAGVLLITDGQSNAGEPPLKAAEYAGSEGIPIVALAAGTPEGPRNAKVTKIEASKTVFVRDPNQLRVILESRGLAKAPATLVMEKRKDGGPWEEMSRQPITLEENGQIQSVPFDFKEDRPCRLEIRATLADVGPELTTDDNIATEEIRVIRQKIRVLFVAGSTFPEVEFLRNAILRDAQVSASTWLQSATADYEQPGNPIIKKLPQTQEELNDYDAVVLYDPDPNAWPQNFPQMLQDFVGKAGGGLVYIAGERSTKNLFDRTDDPATQWLTMLPVVAEPGLYQSEVTMKLSAKEAWKLEITPEGKADPIFQFDPDREKNDKVLANLPGMFWHFPVTRAKPGATVLARHADPRMRNEHGQHVLLATQLVGPGRTFFVAFDSTYRWRYLDEQYFDGFWARVIDRAGRTKQLGGRYPYTLATDRTSYKPGSQVTLTARFENLADIDTGLDALHGEVEVADAPPIPLTLTPKGSEQGVFEATFTVSKPGPHFIKVWSGAEEAKLVVKAATLQIPVELPNLEYERPTLDLGTLQNIAKASGGAVFDLTEVDKIPAAFKVRKVARVLEDRQEIWNAPIIWGGILLAIFTEWVLRKKFRMV